MLLFAAGIAALVISYRPPYTPGSVHWHATVRLEVCGQTTDLPCEARAFAHGENACGTGFLHHHEDSTIHVEGQVYKREDIRLGNFFQNIGARFTKTELLDKENGDACPGSGPGTVQLYVNGRAEPLLDDYVPKDRDQLRIVFG